MKYIGINYDEIKEKSFLSQAVKVSSLNNKDISFIIKSKNEKLSEFDGYNNILINDSAHEANCFISLDSLESKKNTYIIKSPSKKYLLLNMSYGEFINLPYFSNNNFSSTYKVLDNINNDLYSGSFPSFEIFNRNEQIILIDDNSYNFYLESTKLFSSYFIVQQKEKENKKGTFSKLNEFFFKNYMNNKSYADLFDDVFLPYSFMIYKDKITLFINEKAKVSHYINSVNILVSILLNKFNLI